MSTKPFDIGLMVWIDQPIPTLADFAVEAENSGIRELWFPDHYFMRDVYITMAMIAQRTKQIRLGTAVAAVQLRHPTLIASSAMTVDELSNGRAIIGIGPGGFEFAAQFKMQATSPLTMLRESVQIIRGVLAGDCRVKGKYFTAEGSQLTFPGRQIPIHLSARGPKMKELAGEIADGVLIHGVNQRYLEFVKEQVGIGAQKANRPVEACEIGPIVDIDIDDKDEASTYERLRPRMRVMAGGSWSDSLIPIYNLDPESVAKLKAAVSAGVPDVNHLITDDMVRTFGIGGSREKLKEELTRMRDAGLRRVVLALAGSLQQKVEQLNYIKPIIQEVTQ